MACDRDGCENLREIIRDGKLTGGVTMNKVKVTVSSDRPRWP
jgi:hypothetical protein